MHLDVVGLVGFAEDGDRFSKCSFCQIIICQIIISGTGAEEIAQIAETFAEEWVVVAVVLGE